MTDEQLDERLKEILYKILTENKSPFNLNPNKNIISKELLDPANKKMVLEIFNLDKVKEIISFNKKHK